MSMANDEVDEEDTCFGSQNLFSQSPTDHSPPKQTCNQPSSATAKAILQIIHLYHQKLHKAQMEAGNKLEWVSIPSSNDFPVDAEGIVLPSKVQRNLAAALLIEDEDNNVEDGLGGRKKRHRGKSSILSSKAASIFQFKLDNERTGIVKPNEERKSRGQRSNEHSSIGLMKKGTSWIMSKIRLKRKPSESSESGEDVEGKKKVQKIEATEEKANDGASAPEKAKFKANESKFSCHHVRSSEGKSRFEDLKRNLYAAIDTDDDSSLEFKDNEVSRPKDSIMNSDETNVEQYCATKRKLRNVNVTKKRVEDKISCPLCQQEFSSSVINEHAFNCNGEKSPRETRAQIAMKSLDERSLARDPKTIISSNCEETYSAFENACRIALPDRNSALTDAVPKSAPSHPTTEFREKNKLENRFLKKKPSCNQGSGNGLAHDNVKNVAADETNPTLNGKETSDKDQYCGKREGRGEKSKLKLTSEENSRETWISEDSSDTEDFDTTTDIMQQYLSASPKEVQKDNVSCLPQESRRKREKPSVDKKARKGMEKCFICQQNFPSGQLYRKHVEEEMDRMENFGAQGLTGSIHGEKKEEKASSKGDSLRNVMGSRESWNQGQLRSVDFSVSDAKEENTVKVTDVSDSPIKNFKLIDENSSFDFRAQFQGKRKKITTADSKASSRWKGGKKKKKF